MSQEPHQDAGVALGAVRGPRGTEELAGGAELHGEVLAVHRDHQLVSGGLVEVVALWRSRCGGVRKGQSL